MKWVYVASLVLFETGSALCGGSPNMNVCTSQFHRYCRANFLTDLYAGTNCWESDCWCRRSRHLPWVRILYFILFSTQTHRENRGLNIVTVLTSDRERPIYMATMGLCWGLGTILGPVIGGAFSDSSATWRWVGTSFPRSATVLIFE
jgi:MFS family permease